MELGARGYLNLAVQSLLDVLADEGQPILVCSHIDTHTRLRETWHSVSIAVYRDDKPCTDGAIQHFNSYGSDVEKAALAVCELVREWLAVGQALGQEAA